MALLCNASDMKRDAVNSLYHYAVCTYLLSIKVTVSYQTDRQTENTVITNSITHAYNATGIN